MSIAKNHDFFSDLSRERNRLYGTYLSVVNSFEQSSVIERLSKLVFEISDNKYDFEKVEDINSAISLMTKIRLERIKSLRVLELDISDMKREYNCMVSAMIGIRTIECARYGLTKDEAEKLEEYEMDESNPDFRAMLTYRIGIATLTKNLFDMYTLRVRCAATCKIVKSLLASLHRQRCLLQSRHGE